MIKRTLLVMLLAALAGLAQTVDCLVAVVNGKVITLIDVEIAAEFGLGREAGVEAGRDPRLAALDALIERKVVLDLARESRSADRNEIAAALAELRRRLGEDVFTAKLGKFGLAETDLEPYLEDRILFDRALALRFSQTIPVSLTEVERHYRDSYVPEQIRLGKAAEPLERVADLIESRLREERRMKQTADWVRDLRNRADIQIKKDCLK
ncbi:MAG: hypothetical protein A2Y70_03690 [Candidatus Aminicenantes bacterium RBG_13_64_14]|nr:MAG: hypothetical protein A2Y70_03690 [Candidatus Aminicenantes bacterium RBG_13_64_14]